MTKKMKKAKNHWFYNRLLVSYVPIIFAICTILLLLIVIGFNQLSREAAKKESMIIAKYIMAEIDNELLEIKHASDEELLNKGKFMRIFRMYPTNSAYHEIYELSVLLREVTLKYPAIESMYVYRYGDQTIQSMHGVTAIEQYSDRDFIVETKALAAIDENKWSETRNLRAFEGQTPVEVTSMIRTIPISTYTGGFLVINVSTDYLLGRIDHLTDLEHTSVVVSDSDGSRLLESSADHIKFDATYQSTTSNFTIQLGFREGLLHGMMNTITIIYVIIGLMVFAAGLIWLVFTTRHTYKPVHAIMSKLDNYSSTDRSLPKRFKNHIGLVEQALEQLIDRSTKFDQQQKENTAIKRRMFYAELREGYYTDTASDVRQRLRDFGWEAENEGFMMATVEIDGFDKFTEAFSERDQSLLKYAINQVIIDISQASKHPEPWADWLSSNQIALLYPLNRTSQGSIELVTSDLNLALKWIGEHLKTTVSIGIGSPAWSVEEINGSYEEALQMLKFKFTLGNNRIIGHWEVDQSDRSGHAEMIMPTREFIRSLCQGKSGWQNLFNQWFDSLSRWTATKEDVDRLMDGLIYYFRHEASQLSAELYELWRQEFDNRLEHCIQYGKSIDELGKKLKELFIEVDNRFTEIRESKRYANMIREIRIYIDQHYSDPDISLELLSSKFDINTKTLSRLYKEQCGVNFVDYLIQTRIGKSKSLLLESDETIQTISRRVGYLNSLSFTRAFKKIEGITPLELRRA